MLKYFTKHWVEIAFYIAFAIFFGMMGLGIINRILG